MIDVNHIPKPKFAEHVTGWIRQGGKYSFRRFVGRDRVVLRGHPASAVRIVLVGQQ
jgi:hypothetical protein